MDRHTRHIYDIFRQFSHISNYHIWLVICPNVYDFRYFATFFSLLRYIFRYFATFFSATSLHFCRYFATFFSLLRYIFFRYFATFFLLLRYIFFATSLHFFRYFATFLKRITSHIYDNLKF